MTGRLFTLRPPCGCSLCGGFLDDGPVIGVNCCGGGRPQLLAGPIARHGPSRVGK